MKLHMPEKQCCTQKNAVLESTLRQKREDLTSISNSAAMSHSMFSFLFCQLFSRHYRHWNISFRRNSSYLGSQEGQREGGTLFLLCPAPQCQRNTLRSYILWQPNYSHHYSWPLDNEGLNYPGPLICRYFKKILHCYRVHDWLNLQIQNHAYRGPALSYMQINLQSSPVFTEHICVENVK